jgi:hypothetical protein
VHGSAYSNLRNPRPRNRRGDGHIFVEGPGCPVQVEASGTGGRRNHAARETRVRQLLRGCAPISQIKIGRPGVHTWFDNANARTSGWMPMSERPCLHSALHASDEGEGAAPARASGLDAQPVLGGGDIEATLQKARRKMQHSIYF